MPISWNSAFNGLIPLLAGLYPDRDRARLAVRNAGLDPDEIEFDGVPKVFWLRIVEEAHKRDKVPDLIQVAKDEYPNKRQVLEAAERQWATWPGFGHPEREPTVVGLPFPEVGKIIDRSDKLENIRNVIISTYAHLICIFGPTGLGKSALLAWISAEIESGRLRELGSPEPFRVTGIYNIRCNNNPPGPSVEQLFLGIAKMLGRPSSDDMKRYWYDKLFEPSKWVERKTLDLIEKLRRDRRLFLLLDDFDKLLAPDRTIADRNLRVFFELCLENSHSLRFIVASSLEINFGKEVWDQIWRKVRKIELKDGLPEGDAIAWLRELGHDVGVKALQDAPEEQLREAAQHCCYIPKELNSFAGRLASDKNLTLTALLHEAESMTDLNFGKEHFHSLDDAQRRVAGALAVYNEAVSVEAIEALLKPDFPRLDVRSSLDALRHSLAVVPVHGRGDRDSDTYQLEGRYWPYAYQQIPDGDQGYAKRSLHARAADYFLERFLSRSSPGAALDDQATLRRTELHHRLKAADYDGAARLLDEFDEDLTPIYLSIYLDAEREYHLSERILDQYLMWSYLCTLGEAHCNAGQFQEAFRCDEQSLAIARVLRDHHKELGSLIDLGGDRLGQVRTDEAIRFFKKALQIFSEGDNPSQKAIILYNLGICFAWSGETRRAIQFYKRALCTYAPEHKKQRDECLACLGRAYAAQGKANLALHYLKLV